MEHGQKYFENNTCVVWHTAYDIWVHLQKELLEKKYYNTSYSRMKFDFNLNSKQGKE